MLSEDWSDLKDVPVDSADLDRAVFCLIAASEASGIILSHALSDGEYCQEDGLALIIALMVSYGLIRFEPKVISEVKRASSDTISVSVSSGTKDKPV